ncbi:ClpP/crotonase-like domain-containing protein [Chytriomyces sp. MP71]|nr:ClpP/crotonase-like domain-containing protein [Chytriomyces sp. MP71]
MSVQVDTIGGVCTLTLQNEKRANSLSAPMVVALATALDAAEKDDTVRVVVLTGSGKFFCAGMDLGAASAANGPAFAASLALFKRIADFPKPTVARINGPALGGGVGIAFCTDIRVSDEAAFFQLAEVRRGLIPAIISLYIVPQLGPSRSRQYFLTGEKVPAKELFAAGCLAAAVPTVKLNETVAHYTALLAAGGPIAQTTIKRLVAVVGSSAPETTKLDTVKEVFENMLTSPEAAYGMRAFMSKQTPDWVQFTKDASKL